MLTSPRGRHRPTTFAERVHAVVADLPAGEVVTYGEIAAEVGTPGAARAAGRVLSGTGSDDLPWWRVVTATGRLVPGHERRQARLLRAEGVRITDNRVDGLQARRTIPNQTGPGARRGSPRRR